jgi:hypothetical protein
MSLRHKAPSRPIEASQQTPKNKPLWFPYALPQAARHPVPKIITNSVKNRFLDNLSQQCNNKCNNQNKQTRAMTNTDQQNRGNLSTEETEKDTHKQAGSRPSLGTHKRIQGLRPLAGPEAFLLRRFMPLPGPLSSKSHRDLPVSSPVNSTPSHLSRLFPRCSHSMMVWWHRRRMVPVENRSSELA